MTLFRYLALALLIFCLVTTTLPVIGQNNIEVATQNLALENLSKLEQGQNWYNKGILGEAVRIWVTAAQEFAQQGNIPSQVTTLNYLAIAYQDLGEWEKAENAISSALALLSNLDNSLLHAQLLNTQGSLQLHTGKAELALKTWQQAETIYRSLADEQGLFLCQLNQAQALQNLGFYRRAHATLGQINADLDTLPESSFKAQSLRSLGMTLQRLGDSQQSQTILSKSLAIAQQLQDQDQISETLVQIGNTAKYRGEIESAINLYQQATITANNPRTKLEAQLNQLPLLIKTENREAVLVLIEQITTNINNIPTSRTSVYARVNLAESLIQSSVTNAVTSYQNIAQILAKAVEQAKQLQDFRAQTYAIGELGHLYEQTKQYDHALQLTKQALLLAQNIQAQEIAVAWQWQQGRIFKQQGKIAEAIAFYQQATTNLEFLRYDLVAVNPDIQFDYREQVEPVYRQLVQLLLQNVDQLPEKTKQQHLKSARKTIEALQLRELENFFREACITSKPQPIEQIDSTAAVIYPIVFKQSIEVIISLPGQPLIHHTKKLNSKTTTKVFQELRQSLNPAFPPSDILPPAQQVYDWLIRPAQAQLAANEIKTLVFVLDDFLRSIPMSVLHDGEKYIIENYNIAITPGLQLLPSRPLATGKITTLTAGLSESRQGFPPLPAVETEIKEIASVLPTQILFNQIFTRLNFQSEVETEPFTIVHLATHGQFSSTAEQTFVLTWEDRINVKDLDRILRIRNDGKPIELLVLSACQTAKGDNRAELGLAGVAIRSGARSTLATLWSVQDQSTAQLMTQFYRFLTQPNTTKVEALRQAQLSLLKSQQYNHPYYWSPFILVGNWQ